MVRASRTIPLFLLLLCSFNSIAQSTTDSGSFFLHKFAQNIGRETYKLTKTANEYSYEIDFKFTDRGQPVPLKAQLVTTNNHEPISLFIKGSTSRFSTINDTIHIKNKQAKIRVDDSVYSETMKPVAFPVGGYSPGTVQMVLLKYWKKHGKPESVHLLPTGEVTIKKDGRDTLRFNDEPLMLERYVLGGLVWGNEIVWTDKSGNLICLITNDAEGDKLEMMSEAYESLLPELIQRAATYGMKLFSSSMKMDLAGNKILAITGGTVINVEGAKPITNAVILIENGLIKGVGVQGSVDIPASATIIDAAGKFILPGLWDMHAHFQQAEWGPAYLAAGVTTVRDCGNEFEYINAIKAAIDGHQGIGPLILKAGIIDGPGDMGLGVVRATTPEEAIKAVRMYAANRFVQIKVYSSITPAILKVITTEAHRLGLTVTGHIPQNMNIRSGMDSGMDQVNHLQYVYSMMKKNKDRSVDLEDSANIAALDYLKAHNAVIDPTVGVYEFFRPLDEDILVMEPNFYNLPVPLQALFKNTGMPAEQAKNVQPMFQSMLKIIKALYDRGITIVAGTDMGFPGYSLARELELYVQAGLSPLAAIQSATIIPAKLMGMGQNSGSITAGKQADLLILDADPLTEIRNIRKVWKLIKEGQQYDPGVLHKMVGFKK
jgi:imidazolonepropionase-like amidohydrolase